MYQFFSIAKNSPNGTAAYLQQRKARIFENPVLYYKGHFLLIFYYAVYKMLNTKKILATKRKESHKMVGFSDLTDFSARYYSFN